ncbi:transposase, IS605 OrfB family [Pediococcus stilesii]|uniref:Transposase, IS605 OrfB family n=1 Tax=Pediococcus stilesii TaxID=331679 RepID=A0A0R2L4Z0_9LACO|nr:transposase, IS605 OrfB family [Pediococcus stilesii]
MILKGIKVRIYPNQNQQNKIRANFGYTRFVWNQMLNMMITRYENNPEAKFLSVFTLNNLLPALKLEYPWLKDAESTSLQVVNHDLIEAYKKFFKEHQGFPKFKSSKCPKQSYQSKAVNHNIFVIDNRHLKLPKLGVLRFKSGKKITGKIKNVTIRLSSTNKFYAILLVDAEISELPKTNNSVGIDMGVADLMITSDEAKYPTIRFDKILARKKHYWEKRLVRRRLQAEKEIAWDKHNQVVDQETFLTLKTIKKLK